MVEEHQSAASTVNEAAYRVAVGSGIEFGEADAIVGGRLEQQGIAFSSWHCQRPRYDIRLHRREFVAQVGVFQSFSPFGQQRQTPSIPPITRILDLEVVNGSCNKSAVPFFGVAAG
jgi:hypothetical protein